MRQVLTESKVPDNGLVKLMASKCLDPSNLNLNLTVPLLEELEFRFE